MAFLGLFNSRPKKEEQEAQTFLLRFLNERCLRHHVAVEEKRWENRSSLVMGVWIVPVIDGFACAQAGVSNDHEGLHDWGVEHRC